MTYAELKAVETAADIAELEEDNDEARRDAQACADAEISKLHSQIDDFKKALNKIAKGKK